MIPSFKDVTALENRVGLYQLYRLATSSPQKVFGDFGAKAANFSEKN